MNHQPFEDWLLNDKYLTSTEKRELDAHLRVCTQCSALAETGLALRSARAFAPAPGFVLRFQERLAVQKIAERRRKLWGLIVLVVAGIALFGWLAAPYIFAFISSPALWLSTAIGYFLFIVTSLQAFAETFDVLTHVLPDFIPPYLWMMIASGLLGLGLLWVVSIWRFTRHPQGVSV